MDSENPINIFNTYKQENSFTNGLFSLLQLSVQERPQLVATFLRELLHIAPKGKQVALSFDVRVLRGVDHADAELRCGNCRLRFETKIWSGHLRHPQIRLRVGELRRRSGRLKRVVLLTPDDHGSTYVEKFLSKYKPTVLHLGWKRVHNFLEKSVGHSEGTFSEVVRQFLSRIRKQVFEQDYAGVITKVAFNRDTGVCEDTYLEELRKGWRKDWNTPRPYKELDGTGRKLLLYHRGRGITGEAEIKKVLNDFRRSFPSSNVFAGKPTIFDVPISLKKIRSVPGFANFGKYKKDRSPYRNITREQYDQLMVRRTANSPPS